MTQDKMRRMITACVSAATVLLVFLLGFLIYQWISIGIINKKIEAVAEEIAVLEQQIAAGEEEMNFYESDIGLQLKLSELKHKLEMLEKEK